MNKMFSCFEEICIFYGISFWDYIDDECDIDVERIKNDIKAESIESRDVLHNSKVINQIVVCF